MSIFGFRFRARYRCEPMPQRFNELADYNARTYKGILHDPATVQLMAVLQAEFDQWWREANAREGIITVPWEGSTS